MRKMLVIVLVFAMSAVLVGAAGEEGAMRVLPERSATVTVELDDLLPGEGGYTCLGIPWGATPEEVADLLGIDLGEAETDEFPDLGFTREVYNEVDAALACCGATFLRLSVEFRNGGLWCVDGSLYPGEDVPEQFERILGELTGLLGEPAHSVSRDAESDKAGFASELRRWTADSDGELLSTLVLQMVGRGGEYTSLGFGWMLAEPDKLVTE